MAVVLTSNSYGKSRVRLTKVTRRPDRHELAEWSVDVELRGDFADSYTMGDNRKVVATDTMKNTVYVLAKDHELTSPESFAAVLGRHFVSSRPQVESATIRIEVAGWDRIVVGGRPHPHAFVGVGPERRIATALVNSAETRITAGVENTFLLKTTDSAFKDFDRDEFTTLPDADDRILSTVLSATWRYSGDTGDWDGLYSKIQRVLWETFAGHKSLAVQQTLYDMGRAVVKECPAVDEVELTMPNRHRLLVNLKPFDRTNDNEIFVATDEPYGLIRGTVRRKER